MRRVCVGKKLPMDKRRPLAAFTTKQVVRTPCLKHLDQAQRLDIDPKILLNNFGLFMCVHILRISPPTIVACKLTIVKL